MYATISGEASSATANVQACLTAIEARNPKLRALITVTAEQALSKAQEQDERMLARGEVGALAGMTVTLKDVIHTAGIRTTNGSWIDTDFVPETDAEVVTRLIRHGAIVLGKANLHEYAYGGTTQNPFHGSCRNPWDRERIPGGSSGGSSVAVASGMCQVSLGTDTAGSGNLPAALCGIAALRPTIGAVSNRGVTPLSPFFDTISPMARRVQDVERVFRCVAGHDPAYPFSRQAPEADRPIDASGRLDGVRLGVPTNYFFDQLEPAVGVSVGTALEKLVQLGALLVPIEIPNASDARAHYERLFHTDAAVVHRERYCRSASHYGSDTRERLERFGRSMTGLDYAESLAFGQGWQWEVDSLLSDVDAIVHPTTPVTAPTVRDCASTTTATQRLAMFLYPWCLARVPVMTLPCPPATHGLPCGLAVVARQWNERTLFRVGRALQAVTDWHLRAPPSPSLLEGETT